MNDQEEIKNLKNILKRVTSLTYDSHYFMPITCTVCGIVPGANKHRQSCVVGQAEELSEK